MENKLKDCWLTAYITLNHNFNDNCMLVHGMITTNGFRAAHAWIEDMSNHMVIDDTLPEGNTRIPRDTYYQQNEIYPSELTRYTLSEAAKLKSETGTYGPWNDEYYQVIHLGSI